METSDLLKQQGNQAGPEILKAVQNGEITIELSEKAFENGNQVMPDILEALKENEGENVQIGMQQGNQSAPNIISAIENGEISGVPDVDILRYVLFSNTPVIDSPNYYAYAYSIASVTKRLNGVKLRVVTKQDSFENVKLKINDDEFDGELELPYSEEITQELLNYFAEDEEIYAYLSARLGYFIWDVVFSGVNLTESTEVTVDVDGEESDAYLLYVYKPLKITSTGVNQASFTITAKYYNNAPLMFISEDGLEWTILSFSYNDQSETYSCTIDISAGSCVYLVSNVSTFNPNNGGQYTRFISPLQTGKELEFSGDLLTLVNLVGGDANIKFDDIFKGVFRGLLTLVKAADINCTGIRKGLYEDMYSSVNSDFLVSNDGQTFNFNFAPTLPITVDGVTMSTYEDVAGWMGNTNGFYNA